MPQETNLNVAPYFDDFDPQSNYYKVLFKPAYPVQARELNNLQSILQNQVEQFGNHVFKEGAKVIPGQLTYLSDFNAIQIEDTFLGVPVSLYLDQLIGKTIRGSVSGVTAQVVKYITNEESEKGNYTLYVNYFESGGGDAGSDPFLSDEILTLTEPISYATTFIASGEGFAKTLTQNAAEVGSAYAISNGVYYLRGTFVNVYDDILILDQYSNKPNFRIGFDISEFVVSSDEDPSLNDNAKGFSNYTAPGADRLQVTAVLGKRDLDDFEDSNFVQLAEVKNGILRESNAGTEYNFLGDEMARRTFDESGHYYVKEFVTTVKESLNDEIGNRGIYKEGQTTDNGSVPSEDLAIYKISPGKAYVKGYELDIIAPTYVDSYKPRTTKLLQSQGVNFNFGPSFTLNRVYGSPTLGFDNDNYIELRSERVGNNQTTAAGIEIGLARVYDIVLESGSYNTGSPDLNQWDIALFDLQTYTYLDINQSITLNTPTRVKGENSGATAFLRSNSTGTTLIVYDVKGQFITGERLSFNGDQVISRTVTSVTNYEISDIKSLYSSISGNIFSGDLIQSPKTSVGIASISAESGGASIITTPSTSWPGITSTGNIIQYSISTNDVPSLARVTNVGPSRLTVEPVQNVTNYIIGDLPTSDISVSDLSIVETRQQRVGDPSSLAGGRTLFSEMPKRNVSEVDTTSSNVAIRKTFTVSITNGTMSSVNAGTNETFLPFDEERYTLVRSNGQFEILTQDKFIFSGGNTTLVINGLGSNDSGCTLVSTISKSKIKSKLKKKNSTETVIINKSTNSSSGIGGTTLNDGLEYGNYAYGTRVQDEEISINVPDVIGIHAIYESNDASNPNLPSMTAGSLDGPTSTTNDLIVGDTIIGTLSGARAFYFAKKSDTSIEFIFSTDIKFVNGEVINFKESGVSAVALSIDEGDKNILSDFSFINGQSDTFYGVSRIKRKRGSQKPNGPLKVCYVSSTYDSADDGDITTASSYLTFDYGKEIQSYNGFRNTDIIDARPRVSNYTVAAGQRSPFEFLGRSFSGNQHSSKNIIASDESINVDFQYYLGRIDSIYLSPDGRFVNKLGVASDNPKHPNPTSGSMNVAEIELPPYLYNVEDAKVKFISHKRYQMTDIARLEKRLSNLEYYTALSQLETNAINQFTPDANGFDRFKSGIFVDNFKSTIPQDPNLGVRNSIDRKRSILRPAHYTNAFNLTLGNTTIAGIGSTTSANQDVRFADILGTNVRRMDSVLCLEFEEVEWLKNPFATRVESITPYMVVFWAGHISMTPTSDVWIDVNQIQANEVTMEGSFESITNLLQAEISSAEDGNRVGITPVIWDSWETTAINNEVTQTVVQDPGYGMVDVTTTNTQVISLDQQRSGEKFTITERIDTESLGDSVVSREVIHFMRSRNIECNGTSLKPYTRMYSFFDSVDVNPFCTPKLLEIQMTNGAFEVGEVVIGVMPSFDQTQNVTFGVVPAIAFRVASSNHKYGEYNNPSERYEFSPYNKDQVVPDEYSETSTLLNIDTFSLQDEQNPQFDGYVAETMILNGLSSGASATLTRVRLVSDRLGTLIYSFMVPPSNNPSNQLFETGINRMRLTTSVTNSKVAGTFSSEAETTFYSQGSLDTTQETTLSLINADIDVDPNFSEVQVISAAPTVVYEDVEQIFVPPPSPPPSPPSPPTPRPPRPGSMPAGHGGWNGRAWTDPLAQSFYIDEPTGIFVSSIDVFFAAKPETSLTPAVCQLREVAFGTPTKKVLPYSEVVIDPRTITVSDDSSIPYNIKFHAPVYMETLREYCVVFLSQNTEYSVWISRLGETDISTLGQEEGQIIVSTQPLLGSLFKSQNASTWTPSQYEDLTFNLYRANFVSSGAAQFFNPDLPKKLEIISKDNIDMSSREVRMNVSAPITSTIESGNSIIQTNTGATGKFENFAGKVSGLTITNTGVGYTPSAGSYVFSGVAVTSLTGSGINATVDITVNDGIASGAVINSNGTGYQIGDLVEPISIGNLSLGQGMKFTISTITDFDEMSITGIQGRFSTNSADTLTFTDSLGTNALINGGGVYPLSPIRVESDGQHMNVRFRNHGMHSPVNIVKLSEIKGETVPTKLTTNYSSTESGAISIASTSNFSVFEGVGVGATNPGYVNIGSEIISYTGYSGNTLTGITRGVDNTNIVAHSTDDLVYLYEINGVSLRRINRTHNFNNVTESDAITLDSYKLKIDVSDTDYGTNRSGLGDLPELFFNRTKSGGGVNGRSSYNQQFEMAKANFNYITPSGTSIQSTMRTTSGTSVSGKEASFEDMGFESVSFNGESYFDTPRIVASKVNEDQYLDDVPGNKSLAINAFFNTEDPRITPMVDLDRTTVQLTTNRVNSIVTDYSTDPRPNSISDDPTSFIYVTKQINVENPATSIQVKFDAYVHTSNDVRVFYSFDQGEDVQDTTFVPFPGYKNKDLSGRPGVILDTSLSDGTPDTLTVRDDQIVQQPTGSSFKEYTFTAELLPSFTAFRIKVLGTSTNQAIVPLIRNIRVLALA